jgi:hypothetical protein
LDRMLGLKYPVMNRSPLLARFLVELTFYEVETGRRKVAHIFLLCCGPQNSFYISTI